MMECYGSGVSFVPNPTNLGLGLTRCFKGYPMAQPVEQHLPAMGRLRYNLFWYLVYLF